MRAAVLVKSLSTSLVFATCALAAPAAQAQVRALGYGIIGPSFVEGFFSPGIGGHAAGGGEVMAWGRFGGAGEFGMIGNSTSALFVFSANGVAHLGPADARVSPFVTGGYTRMSSGDGALDAWNAGGGADVWLKPRFGLRVEIRDHVRPDSRGTVHYLSFRGGIAFR